MTELKGEWMTVPGGGDRYVFMIDGHPALSIGMGEHQRYPGLIKYVAHGLALWAEKRDAPKDGGKL